MASQTALELMVDAMRTHPDVFIGYGRVRLDDPRAVREIETFKKKGFVGMKFHSPRRNFDDPSYFQAYRLCEEYGMVMLFHTGISSRREFEDPSWGSSARMRPIYLDTICRQFPRAVVQGAHLGNPWYEEAAEAAISNPLLDDVSMKGARGVLINVRGPADLTLSEVNEAACLIQESAHEDANIIFGAVIDEGLNDAMRVTVIATGFPVVFSQRMVVSR